MLSPETVWYQIAILKKQLFLLGEEQRAQRRKLLCLLQLLMRPTWQNWCTDDERFVRSKGPKLSPQEALALGEHYLYLQARKYKVDQEAKEAKILTQEGVWSIYCQEPWIQPERIPEYLFP